ncbi:MAG: hypothetical protein J4452_02230 [Candidatus Aenigmarchaeota archaeon]|nr:hypothetical protein [Candidatus Aenigmarchaeota archaeon]
MSDTEEQKFAVAITRIVDKKTKQARVEMKTMGQGIPISEAIIILEGWMEKVKKELQKPFNFDKMVFEIVPKEKKDDENG